MKPLETFLGKSEVCDLTLMSRAFDKPVFDRKTILLEISEEYERHRYVHIGGSIKCSFLTNDKIYRYVSNMGNTLSPYSTAKGEENIYFSTPLCVFIKRETIDDNDLLKTNKSNIDTFKYYVSNCGKYSIKKTRKYKVHSIYD